MKDLLTIIDKYRKVLDRVIKPFDRDEADMELRAIQDLANKTLTTTI